MPGVMSLKLIAVWPLKEVDLTKLPFKSNTETNEVSPLATVILGLTEKL